MQRPSELYKVRSLMTQGGERIPLIVDAQSGLPMTKPNQYMLRDRRARCETATLEKELRHIALVYTWATARRIDLEVRLNSSDGLSPSEISDLVDAVRADMRKSDSDISSLVMPVVSNPTWASRLFAIRDYISWSLDEALFRSDLGTLHYQHALDRRNRIFRAITARIPDDKPGQGEGLSPELRERLWSIIHPDSVENPWHRALRHRNRLIIELMSKLGPRKSELLKVRTAGVTTGPSASIFISRERDSVADPRRQEPRAKTLERKLPLGDYLRSIMDEYILKERVHVPGSKRTPYLIVSRNGTPLTLSGIREVFQQIVVRHREFAQLLSPHALRHTACDLWWAQLMRNSDLDSSAKKEIFNYIMGWTEGSKQGAIYPRGEIARAAEDLLLRDQAEMFKPVLTS